MPRQERRRAEEAPPGPGPPTTSRTQPPRRNANRPRVVPRAPTPQYNERERNRGLSRCQQPTSPQPASHHARRHRSARLELALGTRGCYLSHLRAIDSRGVFLPPHHIPISLLSTCPVPTPDAAPTSGSFARGPAPGDPDPILNPPPPPPSPQPHPRITPIMRETWAGECLPGLE